VFEIAIDRGGTFTDAVMLDDESNITIAKIPTSIADPAEGLMLCLESLAQQRGLAFRGLLENTKAIVIGTTIATNCVLELKGAKCCMIYTEGFRDILELGSRMIPDDVYNLRHPPPTHLIPRYLRFGVRERLRYDGKVVTPLNEDDVRDAVRKAKAQKVEIPIVCFLHSYINPEHERRAAGIIRSEYPDVVLSSHVLPTRIEGNRFHTATLAGYVRPVVASYVRSTEKRLKENDFKGTLLFMTCTGGLVAPEVCVDNPVLMIGSGPAAGPLFASRLAELAQVNHVSTIDIGGTSVDFTVQPGRRIKTTTEHVVAGHRMAYESVDVSSIGHGGGSIARIDQFGLLRVGPQSAGADPGPACYSKGGQRPTLTDADVVLGYIPTDYFLGGKMQLDADLARKTIEDHIAKPLGIDVVQAAYGIASLVEEDTAERIFMTFVKNGFDPREFTLVVAGGAGPLHAAAITTKANIRDLYIPKYASVFCPCGILLADYKFILSRFYHHDSHEITAEDLGSVYLALEKEGTDILKSQGLTGKDIRFIRGAEIRYLGQLNDVEVLLPEIPLGESFTEETKRALIAGFHDQHKAIYGRSDPSMVVTIETVKLHAIGKRHHITFTSEPLTSKDPSAALKRKRQAYFKETGGFVPTPCFEADLLHHGNVIAGPAIIEAKTTTVVVPPAYRLSVDAYGNYMMRRAQN
jgi:N-methylhydantoinase A